MRSRVEPRPDNDRTLVEKFVSLKEVLSVSCVVADAQERTNVMRSYMKMRSAVRSFIGPALTVRLWPGDLVDCLAIFEHAEAGDVVVIDAFGETETAIWGGLMSGLARAAGIAGAVIDGSVRDTDEARLLDFPIVSKSVTPRGSHSAFSERFEPIEINTVVTCAGVRVSPGDLVVADEIGVTVVPRGELAAVYERSVAQAEKESETRRDIEKGLSVAQLLEKYGRI